MWSWLQIKSSPDPCGLRQPCWAEVPLARGPVRSRASATSLLTLDYAMNPEAIPCLGLALFSGGLWSQPCPRRDPAAPIRAPGSRTVDCSPRCGPWSCPVTQFQPFSSTVQGQPCSPRNWKWYVCLCPQLKASWPQLWFLRQACGLAWVLLYHGRGQICPPKDLARATPTSMLSDRPIDLGHDCGSRSNPMIPR